MIVFFYTNKQSIFGPIDTSLILPDIIILLVGNLNWCWLRLRIFIFLNFLIFVEEDVSLLGYL